MAVFEEAEPVPVGRFLLSGTGKGRDPVRICRDVEENVGKGLRSGEALHGACRICPAGQSGKRKDRTCLGAYTVRIPMTAGCRVSLRP